MSDDRKLSLKEALALFHEGDDDDEEFLNDKKIQKGRRLAIRTDINAFILLDRLVPGKNDLICAASHDEIWFDTTLEKLVKVATREDILDLIRCGVRHSDDQLCMFV